MTRKEQQWYNKLGYYENPFSIKPGVFSHNLVGVDNILKEMFYRIESSNTIFVEGEVGYGKTSILKHIISKFGGGGRRNIIYYSCNQNEDLNLNALLDGSRGFWARLFGRKPRNKILLLDEVQFLSKRIADEIKYNFDQKIIKSIVFTGPSYKAVNFTESLKHRIGNRTIRLQKLSPANALLLVRNRIGDDPMLSDVVIKKIAAVSRYNPRTLLENCEDVCRYAVEKGKDTVKESDVSAALR